MSVPASPRAPSQPTATWKQLFTDTWFYILYFQDPGIADAELGRDPATFLRRFLHTISGDSGTDAMAGLAGPRDGRGMLDRLLEPPSTPDWLTDADLESFAAAFAKTGFTGGLNWYRNFDRNWELSAAWADRTIDVPALFIAGDRDPVLNMVSPSAMEGLVTDLRGTTILPGVGHWTQQESPAAVNAALVGFLNSL